MFNYYWIKNTLKNLLLLFFVCLFLIGMLEVFLRFYSPFDFRVKGDKIILATNITYILENKKIEGIDEVIVHKKNSLGFRGENPPKDLTSKLSIITIGGSTTEDFYLSEGKTWTDVLGMKLKNNFDNLWINNAGLSGQSTFGHTVLMADYITRIRPKIALFLIGSNDIATFQPNEYDENMLILKTSLKSLKSLIKTSAMYSEVMSVVLNIYRYYKARNMRLIHSPINLQELETIELSEESKNRFRQGFFNIDYNPFKDRLTKIIQLSRNNNIEPIFITQPILLGNAVDDITNVNLAKIRHFNINGELYWEKYKIIFDIMEDVGKRENVFVIDLGSRMPKSSVYYYDTIHYTNKGAEKVAEIVYHELCPYLSKKYSNYQINNCNYDS